MMAEVAKIVQVEAQYVWVETVQKSSCDSCAAQKACGYGLLNETAHSRRNRLRARISDAPAGGFQVNDVVQIEFPENMLVKSALLIYLFPLIIMLLTALLTSELGLNDSLVALSAFIAMFIGFYGVFQYLKSIAGSIERQALVRPQAIKPVSCIQPSHFKTA